MKRPLAIMGAWIVVAMMSYSFLPSSQVSFFAPLKSVAFQAGVDGAVVFAEGAAGTHEGPPGFSLAWVLHAFDVPEPPAGAASAWAYYVTLGKPHDGAKPEDVPRGALVFFSGSGGGGHVGIALGEGQMVSDLNIPGMKTGVYKGPLSDGGTLAGWMIPPSDWPGRPNLVQASGKPGPVVVNSQSPAKSDPPKAAAPKPAVIAPAPAKPGPVASAPAAPAPAAPAGPSGSPTTSVPPATTPPPTPKATTTTTSLATTPEVSNAASITKDTPVSLSATITPTPSTATVAGTVQFRDNGTDRGTPQPVVSGVASLPDQKFDPGSHRLTARFVSTAADVLGSRSNAVSFSVAVPPSSPADTNSSTGSTTPTTTSSPPPAEPASSSPAEPAPAAQPQANQPPVNQPPAEQPSIKQAEAERRHGKQPPLEPPPADQSAPPSSSMQRRSPRR